MDQIHSLDQLQLQKLQAALQQSASDATRALETWFGCESMMAFDSVEQLQLSEATSVLDSSQPICCGSMRLPSDFPGQMLMAFDDESGLALSDMVLQQPVGTANEWGEMEESAALESTNILCCAYLNSLVKQLCQESEAIREVIPEPPAFRKDFAESILQFALMDQATKADEVFLVKTRFHVPNQPLSWTLLWIPESGALESLPGLLKEN